MVEIILALVVIGSIVLYRRGGLHLQGLSGLGQGNSKKTFRPVVLAGALLLILFLVMFTEVPLFLIDWDPATTPLGNRLEAEYGEGKSWWMYIIIAAIVIIGWRMIRRTKFNAMAHHVPFADTFFIVAIGTVAIGIVGLVTAWTTDIDDAYLGTLERPTSVTATCAKQQLEELQYTRDVSALRTLRDGLAGNSIALKSIPSIQPGVRLRVCPGDGRIEWLFAERGGQLEITYTSRFMEENPDIVNNFPPGAFLMAQQGAVVDSYYLYVPPSNRETGFISPFELGIDFVEVNVRTVFPTE